MPLVQVGPDTPVFQGAAAVGLLARPTWKVCPESGASWKRVRWNRPTDSRRSDPRTPRPGAALNHSLALGFRVEKEAPRRKDPPPLPNGISSVSGSGRAGPTHVSALRKADSPMGRRALVRLRFV